MNILAFLTGKAHIILIAIAAVGLYTVAVYLKGGTDRERKIRDETKTTFFETIVHDTVYPRSKTISLKPRLGPPLTSMMTARIDSVIAACDSLRGLLYEKLTPFYGGAEDSTLAISASLEDTVKIRFFIDATADPIDRRIAPLTLALAPFDVPKKHTLEVRTTWESDPWYYTALKIGGGFVAGYFAYQIIHK